MIVKELDPFRGGDALTRTGRRAEEQIAFYLRRAFAEDPQVRVLHDLRLERGGEVCQIDHLILHRWGVVIVENKSVTSRVEINERGEWSRLWDGRMRGMPSPVLQARRQGDLLRRLLADHTDDLLGKLLGLIQKQFGNMSIDVLVAVSDDGIIRQPRKPVEEAVCKADQVPDRVRAMIARYMSDPNVFNPKAREPTNSVCRTWSACRPSWSPSTNRALRECPSPSSKRRLRPRFRLPRHRHLPRKEAR